MVCNKCGNELKEGAQFCDKCGKKVKSNNGTKKSNKLPFIIISIIVVIAVIIGFIIINKDNTSKEINMNTTSGINASKELIREDSTAPRGVTYNFKLEDVKRAMDNACKENNTNNYLDFEYSRSQNNVDFYISYKDDTKNDGCLMEVMVYNDYVIGVSFIYYEDMIEELNQNGYNVFFNILRDNYNADYSNKIKSILDNLGNEKHEYFDNTICYKEIQDNFGTTEYSITASTLDSYNELEGASSNSTDSQASADNIDRSTFINNLSEDDKEYLRKYLQYYSEKLKYDINFIEDRFEIVGEEIVYAYIYVGDKRSNSTYPIYNQFYSISPLSVIPANWKSINYSELPKYISIGLLRNQELGTISSNGITDEQIRNFIVENNHKIEAVLNEYNNLASSNSLPRDSVRATAINYWDYLCKHNVNINPDGFNDSSIYKVLYSGNGNFGQNICWIDENIYAGPNYYCKIFDNNKVLLIKYLEKSIPSSNYKEKSMKEYYAVGYILNINIQNMPIHYKFLFYDESLNKNGLSKTFSATDIGNLIEFECLPEYTELSYKITEIHKFYVDEDIGQLANEFINEICNHFGM